jgi:hypothetical protein
VKLEVLAVGVTAGSKEVPGRKCLGQETIIIIIIIIKQIKLLIFPKRQTINAQ